MTFLQIVNKVLLKLREEQVTTVIAPTVQSTYYPELIGSFVNEVKQEVEEAAQWASLQNTISLLLLGGGTSYGFSGLTTEDQLYRDENGHTLVYDKTNNTRLWPITLSQLRHFQNTPSVPTNSKPMYYNISGMTGGGASAPKLTLYPYLADTITLEAEVVQPQPPLEADTDVLLVPAMPVYLGAYARALFERGENQGDEYQVANDAYKTSLVNAVTDDFIRQGFSPNLYAE